MMVRSASPPYPGGEFVNGAERSTRPEQNLADIEGMAARMDILVFDSLAAMHFGQIRAELYQSGTPIGPYEVEAIA